MRKRAYVFVVALLSMLLLVVAAVPAAAASSIELGEASTYTLVHRITIHNDATTTARSVTVTVPLMAELDVAYSQSSDQQLTPEPDEIITQSDGRRYAIYYLDRLAADASVVLEQKYALKTYAAEYDYDTSLLLSDYTEAEQRNLQSYLRATTNISCDDQRIIDFTKEVIGSETIAYRIVRSLFSAVNLRITYEDTGLPQDAVSVLERGTANCEGYTNLLLATLRAAGIYCRQISGYLYTAEKAGQLPLDITSLRHTWVEFYLPGSGWVLADPTFTYTFDTGSDVLRFVDWSYFSMIPDSRSYIFLNEGDDEHDNIVISASGGRVVSEQFVAMLEQESSFDELPFTDLTEWSRPYVSYCYKNGLMQGVSSTLFAPNKSLSRGMFVTILGRLHEMNGNRIGSDYFAAAATFDDIDVDSYYALYIGWAKANGIIQGYGNNHFGADDDITRQQMTYIIDQYLRMIDNPLPHPGEASFSDVEDISEWAYESVSACATAGIITGNTDGSFRPTNKATRAEAAVIFQRLAEYIGN